MLLADKVAITTGAGADIGKAAAEAFVRESIVGTLFDCRMEAAASVGNHPAILPSIGGWARVMGRNTIFMDERDPLAFGFQVA